MNRKSDDFTDTQIPTTESTVRTTGRVKKPKTVFDPSDNYVSRAQRTAAQMAAAVTSTLNPPTGEQIVSTNSNVQQVNNKSLLSASANAIEAAQHDDGNNYDTCVKCFKTNRRRGQGFKSKFLTCKSCAKKWHFSCQNIQFENLILARKRYKCEACRVCSNCFDKKTIDKSDAQKRADLIVCSACIKAYHLDCHTPVLHKSSLVKRTFKCADCIEIPTAIIDSPPKTESEDMTSAQTPEQQEQGDSVETQAQSNHDNVQQPEIDVKSVRLWSVEDVVAFFGKYYPEEAPIFKDHDIDGTSLLLLKRHDIIKRFKLKLGPSLHIYEIILALQTQNDTVENAWRD